MKIPKIAHSVGTRDNYPNPDRLVIFDDRAAMSKSDFDMLSEYSCSVPTGEYRGRMWKRREPYQTGPGITHEWFLLWWDEHDEKEGWLKCEWRKIDVDNWLPDQQTYPRYYNHLQELFALCHISAAQFNRLAEMINSDDDESSDLGNMLLQKEQENARIQPILTNDYLITTDDGQVRLCIFVNITDPSDRKRTYNAFVPEDASSTYDHYMHSDVKWDPVPEDYDYGDFTGYTLGGIK